MEELIKLSSVCKILWSKQGYVFFTISFSAGVINDFQKKGGGGGEDFLRKWENIYTPTFLCCRDNLYSVHSFHKISVI